MTDDNNIKEPNQLIRIHQHDVQYKKDLSEEAIRVVAQHFPAADLTLNNLILCNDEDDDKGPQSTSFCSQYNDIVRRARRRTTGNTILLTTNVLGSLLLAAAMGAAVGQEFATGGAVGMAVVAAAVLCVVGVLLYLRQNAALRDAVHSQLQDLASRYNSSSNHHGVVEIRVHCQRQGLFLWAKPEIFLEFWATSSSGTRKDSNEEQLDSTEEIDEEMGDWGVQLQQQDEDDDENNHNHDTTIHRDGVS